MRPPPDHPTRYYQPLGRRWPVHRRRPSDDVAPRGTGWASSSREGRDQLDADVEVVEPGLMSAGHDLEARGRDERHPRFGVGHRRVGIRVAPYDQGGPGDAAQLSVAERI